MNSHHTALPLIDFADGLPASAREDWPFRLETTGVCTG